MDEMTIWEREIFEKEYADVNWFKGKQSKHVQEMDLARKRVKLGTTLRTFTSLTVIQSPLVLTPPQRAIFDQVQRFVLQNRGKPSQHRTAALTMPNTFPARDRKFIGTLADELHLSISWDEYDEDDQNLLTWRLPQVLSEPLPTSDVEQVNGNASSEDEWKDVDEEDDESRVAVDRVLKKFDKAPVMDDSEGGGFDARYEQSIDNKMAEWKRGYYKVRCHIAYYSSHRSLCPSQGKLGISYDDPKEMHDLIYRYVEGLQWVMHYYYSGIASWGWFYNYHYAPRISGNCYTSCSLACRTHCFSRDLRGLADMLFAFDLGKPFRPFEQLMGVLPSASMDMIPQAYQVRSAPGSISY